MDAYQEQPWKESLCGCLSNPTICCYGCWCCCCLYGENARKIHGHSKCWIHFAMYTCMALLGCCGFLHAFKREELRDKYGLEEDVCGDCMVTCCCAPCAICQEARELQARGYRTPPAIVIQQPTLSLSSALDFEMNHR